MDRWIGDFLSVRMGDGWIDERADEKDGWMNAWMGGWRSEWLDGQVRAWMPP